MPSLEPTIPLSELGEHLHQMGLSYLLGRFRAERLDVMRDGILREISRRNELRLKCRGFYELNDDEAQAFEDLYGELVGLMTESDRAQKLLAAYLGSSVPAGGVDCGQTSPLALRAFKFALGAYRTAMEAQQPIILKVILDLLRHRASYNTYFSWLPEIRGIIENVLDGLRLPPYGRATTKKHPHHYTLATWENALRALRFVHHMHDVSFFHQLKIIIEMHEEGHAKLADCDPLAPSTVVPILKEVCRSLREDTPP